VAGSFIAVKQITIHASRQAVWQALVDPEKVKQYMHGTNMKTDWSVGSPITWKGDGGTVLNVKQDNNASQEEADSMAENNWGHVLEGLKGVAEG